MNKCKFIKLSGILVANVHYRPFLLKKKEIILLDLGEGPEYGKNQKNTQTYTKTLKEPGCVDSAGPRATKRAHKKY